MHKTISRALFLLILLQRVAEANTGNLLLNSGFEDGLNDWTTSGNAALKIANNTPQPYEGTTYIYGSATPQYTVSQIVRLDEHNVTPAEIDSATLRVHFGGWQAGYYTQRDNGTISVYFLDSDSVQVGASSLPSFYSNLTWRKQFAVIAIPPQTRFIRFHFLGIRQAGSGNDAYLDAAFLRIIRPPSIAIRTLGDFGALEITYQGLLFESADLISWRIMDEQPASPYRFFPARSKSFYQAR